MTFHSVESSIYNQLQPIQDNLNLSVGGLPETAKAYGEPAGNGWLSLQWVQSIPIDRSLSNQTYQVEVDYKIDVRALRLRQHMYNAVNEAERLLHGFTPKGSYKPIQWEGSKFYGYQDKKFWWFAECYFKAYVIRSSEQQCIDYSDENLFPPLKIVEVCKIEGGE